MNLPPVDIHPRQWTITIPSLIPGARPRVRLRFTGTLPEVMDEARRNAALIKRRARVRIERPALMLIDAAGHLADEIQNYSYPIPPTPPTAGTSTYATGGTVTPGHLTGTWTDHPEHLIQTTTETRARNAAIIAEAARRLGLTETR